jgi:hypothetical protein
LFVIGLGLFTGVILNSALAEFRDKADLNIYFTTNAAESDIFALRDTLQAQPQVAMVTYTSRADALAEFRERHANDQLTFEKKIKTKNLIPGVYRLEFIAGNDFVTENVTTTQSRLAFLNRLWLTDASRTHFSMFSDSTNIQVQTLNPKSVQTIFVGGEKIDLTETYKQFSHILKNQNREIKEIKLEHDDIIIAGDGVFTFASSDIINPFPRQFTNKTILEKSDIDYVLAHYQPIGSQAPYTRTVVFNVSPFCHDRRGAGRG